LDSNFKTRYDQYPIGHRYIFAKIVDGEAQAIAIFGLDEPIDGVDCYSLGYAVSEKHRRRGLAAEVINKGIEEMKKTLTTAAVKSFYVEAVIDVANTASVRFAEKFFSSSGLRVIERESGRTALQFKRLVEGHS
jgi:RimJ/RimL family protein N-acetyltransferase